MNAGLTGGITGADSDTRRALRAFKRNGPMTLARFASVMWPGGPFTGAVNLLDHLCRLGYVEQQIRAVGPVRYALTFDGVDAAA